MTLEEKRNRLLALLREIPGALVAYSGGVDSTLLLRTAVEACLSPLLAVTVNAPFIPVCELDQAANLTREMNVEHVMLELNLDDVPLFRDNPANRCYHCKKTLFGRLIALARERSLSCVMDASNADDLKDYRPGIKALRELCIRSPLQEVGLIKQEIRTLSQAYGLPTWRQPSMACLATRIPYGQAIDEQRLRQIDACETYLRALIPGALRIRAHGRLARIEVQPEHFPALIENAAAIAAKLKEQDFYYVTLDLEGFRSGSMNETLPGRS